MIEPVFRQNLLVLARAWAKGHGFLLTTASRKLHSDPPFFDQLAKGKCSVTLRQYDKIVQKASDTWPPKTPWPRMKHPSLKRPDRSKPNGKKAKAGKETSSPEAQQKS